MVNKDTVMQCKLDFATAGALVVHRYIELHPEILPDEDSGRVLRRKFVEAASEEQSLESVIEAAQVATYKVK